MIRYKSDSTLQVLDLVNVKRQVAKFRGIEKPEDFDDLPGIDDLSHFNDGDRVIVLWRDGTYREICVLRG